MSSSNLDKSPEDRLYNLAALAVLWVVGGTVTGMIMDKYGVITNGGLDVLTAYVFWPLFALKYALIGVWMVLSNGFSILF